MMREVQCSCIGFLEGRRPSLAVRKFLVIFNTRVARTFLFGKQNEWLELCVETSVIWSGGVNEEIVVRGHGDKSYRTAGLMKASTASTQEQMRKVPRTAPYALPPSNSPSSVWKADFPLI